MPDIDIDFCIERRGEVIEYVGKRYGAERVCQIATFGTLAAKAAVKAVARVLEIPFEESNRISKMIPSTPGTKLADALAEGMELQKELDAWIIQQGDQGLETENLANTRQGKSDEGEPKAPKKGKGKGKKKVEQPSL
jgi:DNA polymerase III alpha subunit